MITTKKVEIGEFGVAKGEVLWEGLQTSAGTIQLSQPLTDFAYVLIGSCYISTSGNNNRLYYHYINFDAGNLKYEDPPYIVTQGNGSHAYRSTYRLGDSNGNSDCITVVEVNLQYYICQIIGFR